MITKITITTRTALQKRLDNFFDVLEYGTVRSAKHVSRVPNQSIKGKIMIRGVSTKSSPHRIITVHKMIA